MEFASRNPRISNGGLKKKNPTTCMATWRDDHGGINVILEYCGTVLYGSASLPREVILPERAGKESLAILTTF